MRIFSGLFKKNKRSSIEIVFAILMFSAMAFGQVHKFTVDFPNRPVNYVTPYIEQFNCPYDGKISSILWGYNINGGSNFKIQYVLPSGRVFEQVYGEPWIDVTQFYGEESGGTWTLKGIEQTPGIGTYQLNTGFTILTQRRARTDLPITGTPVPVFSQVDNLITNWLRNNEFEAATVAIMKDRRLVYSAGYGWQDYNRTKPTDPNAVMRLASNTKMLTAAAIHSLVNSGLLSFNSKIYDVLNTPPPSGYSVADPYYYQMTVQELLDHTSGLPQYGIGSGDLARQWGLNHPATLSEFISYIWTQPLAYTPGTSNYSNCGYQVLGAIVEKVSGMSYDQYIKTQIAQPIEAWTFAVGSQAGNAPNEIWYAGQWFSVPDSSVNGLAPELEQPYALDLETHPAAGSLICSATDYARYLKTHFHNGPLKPASLVGIGWDYTFYGSGPGNQTATYDHIDPDGSSLTFVILCNERNDLGGTGIDQLTNDVRNYLNSVTNWPTNDMFIHTPYNGPHSVANGATLQVEDFDNEGETMAYHDIDATNNGNQYRNSGVDIENCGAGGYNVGWTNPGEWLTYTCNVTAGIYTIKLYAADVVSGSQAKLYQDNVLKATFIVPNTGSYQTWQAITINNVSLDQRTNSVLKLEIVSGTANYDKITFAGGTTTTIVNDQTKGTGLNQFDYNKTWTYFSNSAAYLGDWCASVIANDFVNIRFNGTQIKYFSKKAANRGIAAFSIDGGAETAIDLYNSTDLHQALVFTSPTLAAGNHTLKVRATGNKNPSSTGATISADKVEIISGVVVNTAPTVATPASANPNPVTGATVSLSVLGADNAGESNLTYTWTLATLPPAPVTLSANGTNAAKSVTATFSQVGSYNFLVTIRDQGGLTVTSSKTVTVNSGIGVINVTPATDVVLKSTSRQFTVIAKDQFGNTIVPAPACTWTVSGGGTINSTGLFTAGATVGGPFTITASNSGKSGTAKVSITASTLKAGLVAYYPFTGNANDSSSYNNHGMVTGATLTTDRFGNANRAYNFTPGSDYIKASASGLPTGDRTISVWFKSNIFSSSIFGYGSDVDCSIRSFYMGVGDFDNPYYLSGDCNQNSLPLASSIKPVQAWYHWVVTSDASGVNEYVNDVLIGSFNGVVLNTNVSGTEFCIGGGVGSDGLVYNGGFDGAIDDVRIYNRAMSASEIHMLYVDGASNMPPTIVTGASASPSTVTGTTTQLSVLGADDAGAANLTYTWSTFGQVPAAVNFSANGTNAAKNVTATFTNAGNYVLMVTVADQSGRTTTSLASVMVQQVTSGAFGVSPQTWTILKYTSQQFWAIAKDQFGNFMDFDEYQVPATWTVSGGGTINSTGLFIAGSIAGGPFTITASANGRNATATITLADSFNNAGLVAYYPFNGNAADASVNANNGTVVGATMTTDRFGHPNSAYNFNGTSDYIKASAAPLPGTARTISVWFRANSVSNSPALLGYGFTNGIGSFLMRLNACNNSSYEANVSGVPHTFGYVQEPINGWNHWVVTIDSLSQVSVYINGINYGGGYSGEIWTSLYNDLSIGTSVNPDGFAPYQDGCTGFFNGKIDDVRIYDRPLTGNEIDYLYRMPSENTVYVNDQTKGTGLNQFDYNKTWTLFPNAAAYQGDFCASISTNDFVNIRFNGTQIKFFAKKAANRGIAGFSIDGGAETTVDQYSATDQFQALIYTSPTLAAGNHTLKVRATGNKNSSSTGATISADMVEIFSGADPRDPPSVASAASYAYLSSTTNELSVLGADVSGEQNLTYIWAAIEKPAGATPTLSVNGNNAAKNSIVTFNRAGSYKFQCTITNGFGLIAKSFVDIYVYGEYIEGGIYPQNATVETGDTVQYIAIWYDQFGQTNSYDIYGWYVDGGGTISDSGLFIAGTTPGGPYTVYASMYRWGLETYVTITGGINTAPTVATAAAVTPNPVTATTGALSVLGADNAGEANLTYTWAATTKPTGATVTFSANGNNAAKSSVATFNRAGSYTLQCTITDGPGLTVTSSVNVTVNQTLASITVSPLSASVSTSATKQFSATGVDQFGQSMSPTYSWTVSGGGSISASGLFTAGTTAGGPYTVTASSSGKSATASVTITAPATLTYEAENLTKVASVSTTTNNTTNWYNNSSITLNAAKVGDSVMFTITGVTGGVNYMLSYCGKESTDKGKCQVKVSGTNIGSPIDHYSTTLTYKVMKNAGTYTWPTSGNKTITFKCAGKNAASTGYGFVVDRIVLTPQ